MADYDAGCRVTSTSTKCRMRKSRTSSSPLISRRRMPRLQDAVPGDPQRTWQRHPNPVLIDPCTSLQNPPTRKASHQSLTKKTAAQDEGKAFDTGLVTNFAIFEGGLFQTRWDSFKCIRATVTNHFARVSKKPLVGRIPEI